MSLENSQSVELTLAVHKARKFKCLLECQTPSEYLLGIKSRFSLHTVEEEGKTAMTEWLEGFSVALSVFIMKRSRGCSKQATVKKNIRVV